MIITLFSPLDTIQQELWELFKDNLKINIVINGHNSNRSNTIVRQVYNNTILGPFDLIKTQLLRHKLRYGYTPLYLLLNHNFTSLKPLKYIESRLDGLEPNIKGIFNELLSVYFSCKKSSLYKYENFNIGCILYATLFYIKGVDESIDIMNTILKIPKEVYYHSNKPLQLKTIQEDNINEVYKKCVETVSDAKIGSLERIFNNLKNNGIHEIIYNDEKYYIARLKNVTLPIIGY